MTIADVPYDGPILQRVITAAPLALGSYGFLAVDDEVAVHDHRRLLRAPGPHQCRHPEGRNRFRQHLQFVVRPLR